MPYRCMIAYIVIFYGLADLQVTAYFSYRLPLYYVTLVQLLHVLIALLGG
jgi:hypothetical protein